MPRRPETPVPTRSVHPRKFSWLPKKLNHGVPDLLPDAPGNASSSWPTMSARRPCATTVLRNFSFRALALLRDLLVLVLATAVAVHVPAVAFQDTVLGLGLGHVLDTVVALLRAVVQDVLVLLLHRRWKHCHGLFEDQAVPLPLHSLHHQILCQNLEHLDDAMSTRPVRLGAPPRPYTQPGHRRRDRTRSDRVLE